jgi:hypothetical protein
MRLALAFTTAAGSIDASMGPLLSATAPVLQAIDARRRGIRRQRSWALNEVLEATPIA